MLFKTAITASAIFCGMFFAVIWRSYEVADVDVHYQSYIKTADLNLGQLPETDYSEWLKSKGLYSKKLSEEEVSFGPQKDIKLEADFLKKEVPVLCVIISKGRNKAKAVKDTWSKHCNQVVFYGPYADNVIPVLRYSSLETSHASFCRVLLQLHHKYSGRFKWLLLAEDSSFVLLENARKYVAPLDADLPYYLGRTVQKYSTPPYNAPDSTILMSAGAFELIKKKYFTKNGDCDLKSLLNETLPMSRNYDVSLGVMFNHEGQNDSELTAKPMDTRDSKGRARFMAFPPEKLLIPGMISMFNSFWRSNLFMQSEGENCCSDEAISFSGLTPTQMYLTEYIFYHLSAFRNSPLGLGNKKPKLSRMSMDRNLMAVSGIEVGSPEIRMINKKTYKDSRLQNLGSLDNLVNDVFGT